MPEVVRNYAPFGGGGVQEEIENAKPWMDEEGIKHYKLKASLHNQNP